jgi:hypothetical protein
MPDKWEEGGEETWGKLFPSPAQILALGGTELEAIATMRTAGLSGRKAEYTYLLAQHFSSGHLSSSKLLSLPDADCRKLLTDIRGIGPWTADMFSLFSLRRPDEGARQVAPCRSRSGRGEEDGGCGWSDVSQGVEGEGKGHKGQGWGISDGEGNGSADGGLEAVQEYRELADVEGTGRG